jgi:hypothetical protein
LLLNATVQEIESFVCEFMGQAGTWVEVGKPLEDMRLFLFRLKYVEGGIEYYFDYGRASVSPWIDEKVQFFTKLNFEGIFQHAENDPLKIEHWKEMFQGWFTELSAELLKRFGNSEQTSNAQPIEPWKLSRSHKQDRDKIIWEMRESGEPWEKIKSRFWDNGNYIALSTIRDNHKRMSKKIGR